MRLSVARVLKNANEIKDFQQRKEYLLQNDSNALRGILKCVYDPNIEFLLPETKVPYKPSEFDRLEGLLKKEITKFYLYIKGGNNAITQTKREKLFVEMMEYIDPEDAALMEHVIVKKMPFKNITKNLVEKTYPGLI